MEGEKGRGEGGREGGTTCALPDERAGPQGGGKEVDSTGLCLEYSPPPLLFYGWMEEFDGFPH